MKMRSSVELAQSYEDFTSLITVSKVAAPLLVLAFVITRRNSSKYQNRFCHKRLRDNCTDIVIHKDYKWQTREKPISTRKTLPDDLIPLIVSYLGAQDMCIASRVSKHWFFNCYDEKLWYNLCWKDFSIDPSTLETHQRKEVCSRTLYILLHEARRSMLRN